MAEPSDLREMFDDRPHAADMALLQLGDTRTQFSIGGRSLQYHLPDRSQAFQHRPHHPGKEAEFATGIALGANFSQASALQ